MNCERFQTVAVELARNQIIYPDERTNALAHVTQCDRCGQILANQSDLSETLRTMAGQMKSVQAPSSVERSVLAAFGERTSFGRSIQPAPARWRYWASAAAAVLLLGLALFAWRWHAAPVRQPPALASSNGLSAPISALPRREESPAVEVASPRSSIRLKAATSRRSLLRHPALPLATESSAKRSTVESPALNAETNEVVTDFVPIGYSSALDLQDGGQMVRVELPGSALARFGLPINMNRADERIKADVLVGTDGLARAIRLVALKSINKN